ncbi:hypothetical protein V5799_004313 [Amblyomma americanum]|uniref:Uncharacterized protein n=1 Tax=Amblyomma americanum TaxID=6943 RepID=A0AAQ4D6G5_AMBAM
MGIPLPSPKLKNIETTKAASRGIYFRARWTLLQSVRSLACPSTTAVISGVLNVAVVLFSPSSPEKPRSQRRLLLPTDHGYLLQPSHGFFAGAAVSPLGCLLVLPSAAGGSGRLAEEDRCWQRRISRARAFRHQQAGSRQRVLRHRARGHRCRDPGYRRHELPHHFQDCRIYVPSDPDVHEGTVPPQNTNCQGHLHRCHHRSIERGALRLLVHMRRRF